jgi:hypothetical protein
MKLKLLTVCLGAALLSACGGGAELSASGNVADPAVLRVGSASSAPLRVVSTPNPNVFPLLLAMARQPGLPVALVPIADGAQIDSTFAAGQADALLSMTYTAAKKVVSGKVPTLQLLRVNLWRGFSALSPQALGVSSFSQLVGKGVLVSGPTSGGKGGGPDLIFQAALRRSGYSAADFKVCYLPVMQAAPMMSGQQKMNTNPACDPSFDMAPSAISLVEPAATGLVMQTMMPVTDSGSGTTAVARGVDYQQLFTGFTAWPQTQLPHGGLSILAAVADDASRAATTRQVLAAYDAAVAEIESADTMLKRLAIAQVVSAGIASYYGSMGLDLPAPVIVAALSSGELVMRHDLSVAAVRADLDRFLTEVVGAAPPTSFYRSAGL